jgi:ribonuclease P protein component
MASLTFKRGERLKSSKVISQLFAGGCPSVKGYPILAVYTVIDEPRSDFPVQIAFSVPKRRFKSAVKRNQVRRKIKEAYRLQKAGLYEGINLQEGHQLAIMLIYISNDIPEFNTIEKAIKKLISRLVTELS